MSLLIDLKYDHPKAYRSLLAASVVAGCFALVAVLPEGEATRAMGLVELRERAAALRMASYWQARALINPRSDLVPVVEYGFVLGLDTERRVAVSLPDGRKFVTRKLHLADVVINDSEGAARLINSQRQLNARIDTYGNMAVIWIDDRPLNIELIKAGLASPEESPPTNIVDQAFASYFWSIAKGARNVD